MVARAIPDRFGAAYGPGGALKLAARMNFSVRKARPVPYNTASPEEIDAYVGNTIKVIRRHADLDYSVICLDAAGLVDSRSPALGIRPRGGRDTVGVSFAAKTTRIIGALGAKTLDIRFHEKAGAPALISLLEYVRWKRGRIFVIPDSAGRPPVKGGGRVRQEHGRRGGPAVPAHAHSPAQPDRGAVARDQAGHRRRLL